MNDNRITQNEIDSIMSAGEADVEHRKFGNMTVVHFKTPWGFYLTETSACIDPENYDEEIGEAICLSRIEQRLWQLEGYYKMKHDWMDADYDA